jgi:hypothetical protein
VGARLDALEDTVNVFAFSTPLTPEWCWRIVVTGGAVLEESSTAFGTIAQAMAAGRERVQLHLDSERPTLPRVPWHRR